MKSEEDICVSPSNNCDIEQYNTKSDSNVKNCGNNTNDRDNIMDSARFNIGKANVN